MNSLSNATLFLLINVGIGPKQSTNRNLKQITAIECTKTVIFLASTASIVPQLSKCLKFEAVWGVLTDQRI